MVINWVILRVIRFLETDHFFGRHEKAGAQVSNFAIYFIVVQ